MNDDRPLYHVETLWFKDDVAIENSGLGHTFNDPWNRTLSLLNADTSHSGRYTCRVSTKSPLSEPVTAFANVTVLGKTPNQQTATYLRSDSMNCTDLYIFFRETAPSGESGV